jgi:hypothetical protein
VFVAVDVSSVSWDAGSWWVVNTYRIRWNGKDRPHQFFEGRGHVDVDAACRREAWEIVAPQVNIGRCVMARVEGDVVCTFWQEPMPETVAELRGAA